MSRNGANRAVRELNSRYGNHFGTKVYVITAIVSLIFAFAAYGVMLLVKDIDRNSQFTFESGKKFIIHNLMKYDKEIYYEIDLSKPSIIKRYNDEDGKRVKLSEKGLNFNPNELEQILKRVTKSESNKEFAEEARNELLQELCSDGVRGMYKIQTSEDDYYYVKDYETNRRLKKILEN